MRVKFGTGTKDVPITEVTPENYIVSDGEQGDYHCIIEIKQFDPKTGRRLSKPRVQKFDVKVWQTGIERNLRQQGYDVTVLHNPTDWLREQEEKLKQTAAQRAEAARKAEEKRKDAERAALKKEILAELKKEGLLKTK